MNNENKVTFRTYCGEAGDLHELLIAECSDGQSESMLIYRKSWFKYFEMQIAKKRLLCKLLIRTGRKYYE